MNNSYLFIALLLCLALLLTFFFPPIPALAADDHCWIEYAWPDCNDSNLFNGYWWRDEGFVPGMITRQTHFISAPPLTMGVAVYYAEGLMEATARYRGLDLSGYVDGVAMMSCADIGQTVWISRYRSRYVDALPASNGSIPLFWEGPFLVVDCAEWDDHYPISVFRNEVVEVGFETAKRWGMMQPGTWNEWTLHVRVLKSRYRPPDDFNYQSSIWYPYWFEEVAKFYNFRSNALPNRPIFTMRSEKLLWFTQGGRTRKSYLAWQDNPRYIEPWIRDTIYRKD
ncbi:hypothetical protein LCGC14_1937260 [marine sediment metagenome]|uniref:Uncharacterized protein n=1 Tax=marine sediment metagenome TaxID=412755 RepID=A0A0F9G9U0_9ZZZZ